jgi:hypothetical protein
MLQLVEPQSAADKTMVVKQRHAKQAKYFAKQLPV